MTDVLTACTECDLPLDDCTCPPRIIKVRYGGFAGDFETPPEPAELDIWCPVCQEQTEAVADYGHEGICLGGRGKPEHDVILPDDRP